MRQKNRQDERWELLCAIEEMHRGEEDVKREETENLIDWEYYSEMNEYWWDPDWYSMEKEEVEEEMDFSQV